MNPSSRLGNEPTSLSAPWWEALADRRLTIQRCTACGVLRLWPRPMCAACHSMAFDWAPAPATASVHSWTVTHHPFHPAMKNALPFAMVTADVVDGVRLLGRYLGDPAGLAIGMRVRIVLATQPDGAVLSAFEPEDVNHG